MNARDRQIIEAYRSRKGIFLQLGNLVHETLHTAAKSAGVAPIAIEHRVKTEESLLGKLYRDDGRFWSLDDLTDILGARVICFFEDEVDLVGKQVEQLFRVDRELSTDKRALIQAESFGYLSLHYICSLPEGRGYPEELLGLRFEIQIRTGLQHIWAAITHDTVYKSQFGVPREIRRGFSRLAGLLELADSEFVRVRDGMRAYTEQVRRRIRDNEADDVLIDMVSLREYMRSNQELQGFLGELAAIEGSEIAHIDPEAYLEQLFALGIDTLGGLQSMLRENRALALRMAEKVLRGSELDILSSNAALRFLCRAELIRRGASEQEAAAFLLLSARDEARAQRQAAALLADWGDGGGGAGADAERSNGS